MSTKTNSLEKLICLTVSVTEKLFVAHVRLPFRRCHSADKVRSLDIPRHGKVAVLCCKN